MPEDTPVINQIRVPPGRREDVSRQRPDQRLRQDRPRRQRARWAGSTSRRSRSRTASKAKRRWAWNWPSRSDWRLPDVILYPTGGGTGLIGMWKAFDELRRTRLARRATKLPRMVAVQVDGCAPIVRAFDAASALPSCSPNAADHRQRHSRAGGRRRLHDPRRRSARAAAWRLRVEEARIREWIELASVDLKASPSVPNRRRASALWNADCTRLDSSPRMRRRLQHRCRSKIRRSHPLRVAALGRGLTH